MISVFWYLRRGLPVVVVYSRFFLHSCSVLNRKTRTELKSNSKSNQFSNGVTSVLLNSFSSGSRTLKNKSNWWVGNWRGEKTIYSIITNYLNVFIPESQIIRGSAAARSSARRVYRRYCDTIWSIQNQNEFRPMKSNYSTHQFRLIEKTDVRTIRSRLPKTHF